MLWKQGLSLLCSKLFALAFSRAFLSLLLGNSARFSFFSRCLPRVGGNSARYRASSKQEKSARRQASGLEARTKACSWAPLACACAPFSGENALKPHVVRHRASEALSHLYSRIHLSRRERKGSDEEEEAEGKALSRENSPVAAQTERVARKQEQRLALWAREALFEAFSSLSLLRVRFFSSVFPSSARRRGSSRYFSAVL